MKLSVLSLLTAIFGVAVAWASTGDTLSYFDPYTASTFYRDQGIQAQAARFDLSAPAYVRRLTVWFAGRGTGTARVTIYGNEGAFSAPLLGEAIGRSVTIRKDRAGVQKVEVILPGDVFVEGAQFFVAVSGLSEGVVLLSDRREKRPRCESGSEVWYYQAIKGIDGVWRGGKYGYAITAIVDYPEVLPPTYLADITEDAGFIPSSGGVDSREARGRGGFSSGGVSAAGGRGGFQANHARSISWADIDNDGRPEVMVDGHLYINKSEGTSGGGDDQFEDATDRLGDGVETTIHHFVDIENDGDPDILLLGLQDGASALLENDGDGYFHRRELQLPTITNPTTVTFADIDGDLYLDIFIGQGVDDTGASLPSYVLRNDRGKDFILLSSFVDLVDKEESSAALQGNNSSSLFSKEGSSAASKSYDSSSLFSKEGPSAEGGRGSSITSSQWIDYDSDGDPDLYLTTTTGVRLLLNDGNGHLTAINPLDGDFSPTTTASGTTIPFAENGANSASAYHTIPSSPFAKGGPSDPPTADRRGGSQVFASSDWADYNSDGTPDLLQPVIYRASALDELPSETSNPQSAIDQFPYQGFSGGGTWADVDNDGRLDALVTSDCDCRFASLYVQDPSGTFVDKSFEYGLFRLPAGADAVWVDYNNDGKLDVATFVGGRFLLLKNTGDFNANYIEADLSGSSRSSEVVGGTVTIWYGEKKQVRPIVSGRGALMQGPLRLHFGLGDVATVDSLVVEWDGGERRTLIDPAVNKIHYPFNTQHAAEQTSPEIAFTAWPNPFRSALNFRYTVAEKTHVRLEIHRLDGELLSVLIDEDQGAGDRTAEWRATDGEGRPLPAGTYIYRARIGSHVITGRAVLAK